ncbi:hypothetical protein [Rubeoparvulum massiliense]|uniref:hypothetical protein n=1 Tax=Rubeoparvulum massiliense TaxID=1631346 RepID=UPI00065E2ECB|nr:hypothetical protein [Rubeoparvulum massiliense]
MKKVVSTNILLFLAIIGSKLWYFMELRKWSNIFSEHGGGKVESVLNHLYLYQHEDVIIAVTDYTIYIIILGLLINLLFLFQASKKATGAI